MGPYKSLVAILVAMLVIAAIGYAEVLRDVLRERRAHRR